MAAETPDAPSTNVAVVGGGIMGSGIAQVSAMAGHQATVLDVGDAQLDRARNAIDESLSRLVGKGELTQAEAQAVLTRLRFTTSLRNAVTEAQLIVEAAPEKLSLKQQLIGEAAQAAPPNCLLATNTSQLSIGAIGEKLGDNADRLVGMHFFNPPVLMRLVELMASERTSTQTLERARAFAHGLGKETIVCNRDSPGFVSTRCSVILRLECLRMLEEGVATAEDIDKALRLGLNHPMGPLELGDLVGLDTFLQCADGLAEAHGERFDAPEVARTLVERGRLGRKSGEGIYAYDADGRRTRPAR